MNNAMAEKIASTLAPMEGWCDTPKAMRLCHYIITENLLRCLEIGVYGGRSVAAMALAHQFGALNGIVVGIDPWRNEDAAADASEPKNSEWWGNLDLHYIHTKCMKDIWSAGLNERIVIIRNTSEMAAKLLDGQQWDLVHIDGCHAEAPAIYDIKTWVPRVRKGGLVVYDDMQWSTSGNAVPTLKAILPLIEEVGHCGFFRA